MATIYSRIVTASPFAGVHRNLIVTLAARHKLPETNEVGEQSRKLIVVAVRPAVLDDKIPSFPIAELTKARAKGLRTFGQAVSSG